MEKHLALAKELSDPMSVSERMPSHGATPKPIDRNRVAAISNQIASLPLLNAGRDDEILGYVVFGIPR
jgi:hypothetical protein